MAKEKRQRQKEGRQLRLEEQRAQEARDKRFRLIRGLVLVLVVIVGAAFLYSVLSDDDGETEVTSDPTATSTPDDATDEGATDEGATDEGATDEGTTDEGASDPGDPAIGDAECPPADGSAERTTTFDSGPQACIDPAKAYTATVATSKGEFTIELDPAAAPKAVNNFVFLARYHFFDGVAFHRIIPGFVVQGGDANGDPPGTGDPGYSFPDELPTGEAPHYQVGSVAMANSGPDTNGSQFFVVTGDNGVSLPPNYTLFGQVTEGMDVVEAIEATGTEAGTPTEETVIESVTVTES